MVALTSHISDITEKRCTEAGFDFLFLTPLAVETILHEIIPKLNDRRLSKMKMESMLQSLNMQMSQRQQDDLSQIEEEKVQD